MSVEKIERLIALALSTSSEEEARTAALTAVRLINKGGFKIQSQKQTPYDLKSAPRGSGFANPAWDESAEQIYRNMINEIFRGAAQPTEQGCSFRPSGAPNGGMWCSCDTTGLRCHKCGRKILKGEQMYVVGSGLDVQTWCGDH